MIILLIVVSYLVYPNILNQKQVIIHHPSLNLPIFISVKSSFHLPYYNLSYSIP
ncbi:hypothetical protein BDB01DRAFT_809634 [Pilobolus umbonatus]|nr:hypothetical protein BDB01DRAFT_809634 [Pilobolus umbonatus]